MQFENERELYKTVGQNIKYYRKCANMTQARLAEKSHLSLSYITKIEAASCNKSISLSALHQIARALNVEITLFLENQHTL